MPSTFPVFDPVSPQAEAIRELFVQVLIISAVIFSIVAELVGVALWKFRDRKQLPEQEFGSQKKELMWLVGPVIIILWQPFMRRCRFPLQRRGQIPIFDQRVLVEWCLVAEQCTRPRPVDG